MDRIKNLLIEFWIWTGLDEDCWWTTEISEIDVEPLYFPQLDTLRNECEKLLGSTMDEDDLNLLLLSMALDGEDERILDCCRGFKDYLFLEKLVAVGVFHPQSEARWQLTEILRNPIPNRMKYLLLLAQDDNAYVRKRAHNVLNTVAQSSTGDGSMC